MVYSQEKVTDELQAHRRLIEDLRATQGQITTNIENLGTITAGIIANNIQTGQIDNLIRNSKLRHAWNSWVQSALSGTDTEQECAHVYTHGPDVHLEAFTGAITATDTTLTIDPADGDFIDPDDIGAEIVVEGAGAAGADLVTTIASVTSTHEVELALAAGTTVSGDARVRWRLATLNRNSTYEGTTPVNSTLKYSDHTGFASNISDPWWNKPNGYAEIGSIDPIDFPMGYWDRVGARWVFQNLIEPSKTYYFICRMARKSAKIIPRGMLKVSLYDDSPGKKQSIEGGRFTLAAVVEGTPTSTTSSDYQAIARTDQGEVLTSNIVTINRPADAAFVTDEIYTLLSWTSLPGIRILELWRKTGGTYVMVTKLTNGNTIATDQGSHVETGTAFPTGDIQRRKAEGFTRATDFDTLVVNGEGVWDFVRIPVFVPPSYDTTTTTRQWVRAGLTEACDKETTDGITINTDATLSTVDDFFEATDAGLAVIIQSGSHLVETTIDTFTDSKNVELIGPLDFDATGATITVTGGGRNGILIGEFGLSLTPGGWAANHDDSLTAQGPVSNPEGSTVGTNNPGGDPPGGGILCVRSDMRVRMFREDLKIEELPIRVTQVGNLTASGNLKPNTVLKKKAGVVECLLEITAGGRRIFCTPSEPFFRNFSDFDSPVPAHKFDIGDTIAMNPTGKDVLATIDGIQTHFGRFEVETYESMAPGHISIIEGFYRHNRKADPGDGGDGVIT